MKMIKRFTLVLSSIVLASMALTSHAQYPESPVKMIVGFPAWASDGYRGTLHGTKVCRQYPWIEFHRR
jgi:hypothetical protein